MAHFRSFFACAAWALLVGPTQVACSSSGSTAAKGAANGNENGSHFDLGGSSNPTTGTTGSGGGNNASGFDPGTGGSTALGAGGGGGASSMDSPGYGRADAGASVPGGAVKAGEWDDNANYREFLTYLKQSEALDYSRLDVSQRQFIVVVDGAGHAVANCPIVVSDGTHSTSLRTSAAGRTPLFPKAVGLVGDSFSVQATCVDGSAQGALTAQGDDNLLVLHLAGDRSPVPTKSVELAFILDTTGSMAEEIDAIKSTVSAVAEKLTPQQGIALRVGLVAYKDYGDSYVTKTFPFATDLASFRASIASLSAQGGGDIPEAVNEALHVAGELDWHDDAFARFAFLVADAPPHMREQYDYAAEAKSFLSRGIQVFTVNASGQDAVGQLVFRQIAQYTYATNMFVLRGGAGPQSTGGGDPKTSCGTTQTSYASGNLDDLIVTKVLDQVALYDHDPLQIPGLGADTQMVSCPDAGTVGGD
jgi:Mg-chelatase subunit ChlD